MMQRVQLLLVNQIWIFIVKIFFLLKQFAVFFTLNMFKNADITGADQK